MICIVLSDGDDNAHDEFSDVEINLASKKVRIIDLKICCGLVVLQ